MKLAPHFCFINNHLGRWAKIYAMSKSSSEIRTIFKEKSVQQAFVNWLNIGAGINPNPCDKERFYNFCRLYHQFNEHVDKQTFCREAKKVTHCTIRQNRGICQDYYNKLQIVDEYLTLIK